jgi:prepilin-type N-terminal cleavage/methylation domain-containing protein
MHIHAQKNRGFTLIEMLIAVTLFSVVMLVAVGTLLSLVTANRKAQALQSVMNNLNIALDDMARSIRMGSQYHAGSSGNFLTTSDGDNVNGEVIFAFEPYGNKNTDNPTVYWYDSVTKAVYRCRPQPTGTACNASPSSSDPMYVPLTSPEVLINNMKFYAAGTTRGDIQQPRVVMVIQGTASASDQKAKTTFHVQVTAAQRLLDL